jgi:amino acid permease
MTRCYPGIFVDAGVAGGNKISFSNWKIDGAPFVGGALSVFMTCLSAFFSFGGTGRYIERFWLGTMTPY